MKWYIAVLLIYLGLHFVTNEASNIQSVVSGITGAFTTTASTINTSNSINDNTSEPITGDSTTPIPTTSTGDVVYTADPIIVNLHYDITAGPAKFDYDNHGGGVMIVRGLLATIPSPVYPWILQDEITGEQIKLTPNPDQVNQLTNIRNIEQSNKIVLLVEGNINSISNEIGKPEVMVTEITSIRVI